jgi:hypothetical protein
MENIKETIHEEHNIKKTWRRMKGGRGLGDEKREGAEE